MEALAILEVTIGIVLVYLVLSLVCTSLLEAAIAVTGLKGTVLREAIEQLMDNERLADEIYADPEIAALSSRKGTLPSYIPADVFARSVLNVATGGAWSRFGGLPTVLRGQFVELSNSGQTPPPAAARPSAVDGASTAAARRSAGRASAAEAVRKTANGDAAARDAAVREAAAKRALGAQLVRFIDEANGDVALLKNKIELWFDRTGDRSTGWFKRRVNLRLIILGLFVALAVNADTVVIFQRLSSDSELRTAAITIAEERLAREGQAVAEGDEADAAADGASDGATLEAVRREVGEVAPFIGWSNEDPFADTWRNARWQPVFWMQAALKLIGLSLTAFAISIGAPFWFDLLQKLVSIRKSVVAAKAEELPAEREPSAAAVVVSDGAAAVAVADGEPGGGAYMGPMAGFSPTAAAVHLGNAYWLARAADLAYEADAAKLRATLTSWGLSCHVFESKDPRVRQFWKGKFATVDTQAFVAADANAVLVCFRGTEPTRPADIVTDLSCKAIAAVDYGSGTIHSGFKNAIDSVWDDVAAKVAELGAGKQTVWFAGHSLGGALAVLAASRYERLVTERNAVAKKEIAELEARLEANPGDAELIGKRELALAKLRGRVGGVYTIGQPRVGDAAFTKELAERFGERHVRIVNNRDVVPRVPLRAMDFDHSGTVLYLDEFGRLHRDPGLWFRLLDTVVISRAEVEKSREGVQDHSSSAYVDLLDKARKSTSALTRLAAA